MLKHLWFILCYPKIGPDMYLTHWLLFFKPIRLLFCRWKIRRIGENSEVRPFAIIDGTNNVSIGRNVIIPGGVGLITDPQDSTAQIVIEDDVLFGPNAFVYSTTHNYSDPTLPIKQQGVRNKATTIKKGAWIGIGAVILPGVTVGINSVVGAHSVVTKDVPDFSVVAGAPAKTIRTFNPNIET